MAKSPSPPSGTHSPKPAGTKFVPVKGGPTSKPPSGAGSNVHGSPQPPSGSHAPSNQP
jgi:hypothetical protein